MISSEVVRSFLLFASVQVIGSSIVSFKEFDGKWILELYSILIGRILDDIQDDVL